MIALEETDTATTFETKLHRFQRQRDLAMRGADGSHMSPELAEALRTEIRTVLDAGGKPFDVNVARRVYDLAIAAKDMCVAATGSVEEAIAQIKDTNGPMETLDAPGTPESAAQASETFGARIFRELLAGVQALTRGREGADPQALVHALVEARLHGMHDVAAELEQKLFGRVLEGARPVLRAPEPGDEYQRAQKIADVRAYAPTPDAPCLLCGHPAGAMHKAGCGNMTSDAELDRLALVARGWTAPKVIDHRVALVNGRPQCQCGISSGIDDEDLHTFAAWHRAELCASGDNVLVEIVLMPRRTRPPSGMENAFDASGESA